MDGLESHQKQSDYRAIFWQMLLGALFLVAVRALLLFVLFNVQISMGLVLVLSFIIGPNAIYAMMYAPIFLPLLFGKVYWMFGAAVMALLLIFASLGMRAIREDDASRYTTTTVTKPSRHHDLVASIDPGRSIEDAAYLDASDRHRMANKTKDGWVVFQRTDRSDCGAKALDQNSNPYLLDRTVCLKRTLLPVLDDALVFRRQSTDKIPAYDVNGNVAPFPSWFAGDSIVFSEVIDGKEIVLGRRLQSMKGYKKNVLSFAAQLMLGAGDWDVIDQGPNIDAWVFMEFARRTPAQQAAEEFAFSGVCEGWIPPRREANCRSH